VLFEPARKTSNRLLVAQTYPPLNHHVQQLLVTLLFLRGITDEHGVATSRSRRSARFFVKAIGWQVRLGYRYTEGSNQTPQRCRCVGGCIAIFIANLRPTSRQDRRGCRGCFTVGLSSSETSTPHPRSGFAQRNVRCGICLPLSDIPGRNMTRTRSCWTRLQD
jgi:hypothetical protein